MPSATLRNPLSRWPGAAYLGLGIGVALLLSTSGSLAADFGSACCADLEERVAELEETAVRKGNRRVSLFVSGQVSRSILAFDDGGERNAYVVDGPSTTRFRFEGSTDLTKHLTTGFFLELAADNNPIGEVDQERATIGRGIDVAKSVWFIRHAHWGAITVGFAQPATGDTLYTNLGGQDVVASPDVMSTGGNMATRSRGIAGSDGLNFSNGPDNISLRWRRLTQDIGTSDRNMVRYDSPAFAGFVLASAWGADDFWDVNLRYAKLFNGFAFSAQAGYSVDTSETTRNFGWPPVGDGDENSGLQFGAEGETRVREFQASASLWHMGSGLFASAAYQKRTFGGNDPGMLNSACNDTPDAVALRAVGVACKNRPDFDYFWTSAGVRRKWTDLGWTTFYGEYAQGRDGVGGLNVGVVTAVGGDIDFVNSSKVEVLGAGLVQTIDAAAMDVFFAYRNYRADVTGLERTGARVQADIDNMHVFVGGARIRF